MAPHGHPLILLILFVGRAYGTTIGVYQGEGTSSPGSNSNYYAAIADSAKAVFDSAVIKNLTVDDIQDLGPWGSSSAHGLVSQYQ